MNPVNPNTVTTNTSLSSFSARRTLGRLALCALTILAVLAPAVAGAATLQVCSTCTYTTIQGAVNAAASGDSIEIAAGTYNESVSIAGARSLVLYPMSGRVTLDATGFDRALEILDPAADILVEDFDLKNANGYAGLVNRGRATLVTVHVVNNSGSFGGIFNTGTLLTYTHSLIGGNTSTALGSAGGLNNFGWVDLWHTTVLGNQGHEGGGFKTSGTSRVSVWYSSISNNSASSMGGGYFNSSPLAVVHMTASSFSANSAPTCSTRYDVNLSPSCI